MKHPAEEDIFMLAHRSIGLSKAIGVWLHIGRCKSCATRYREAVSMTSAVAGAVRGRTQVWRPFDRTLRTQAFLALLLFGLLAYGVQRAILASNTAPESWHNAAEGACLTPEDNARLKSGAFPKPTQQTAARPR